MKHLLAAVFAALIATHSSAFAAPQKIDNSRSPDNKVDDTAMDEEFFAEEEAAEAKGVDENLSEEEIAEDVGETKKITKEIVEEAENPKPEFPYPGATEEGFEEPAAPTRSKAAKAAALPERIEPIKPVSISSSGEYFYGFKSSSKDSAASVRIGFFAPPDIINPINNETFENIYGDSLVPTLFFDYEWMLTRAFGDLGLKAGSGVFIRQGKGRFANQNPERYGREPDEKYSFVMFPNTISAIYRFQYSETQMFVPYVEGGGGYFTFAEIRDDGDSPKFGGAPIVFGAGGISFLVDWMDPQAIRELDNEFGINHMRLIAEFRLIQGLHDKYDFSASVINTGINVEF